MTVFSHMNQDRKLLRKFTSLSDNTAMDKKRSVHKFSTYDVKLITSIMNHRYVNIVWAADMSLPRLKHALSIIYTNRAKGKTFR
jgi:hypothetical protein